MEKEKKLSLLRSMVEIPSESKNEQKLANYLCEEMNKLGFASFIDDVGNVIGELGNDKGPVILMLGHIDTVPGKIFVKEENNKLYGRGSVDAKGSLATFICASESLSNINCKLIIVGAVEEELKSSKGAKNLKTRYNPDLVIIGEPSGYSNVVLGYKGCLSFKYRINKPAIHSSSPLEKASEAGLLFWEKFKEFVESFNGSDFYTPSCTILNIAGDLEDLEMDISCRIPPNFDIDTLKTYINSIQGSSLIEYSEITPAVMNKRDSILSRSLLKSIRDFYGDAGLKVKTGTSDMNIVSQFWNVPMIAYGPGDSKLDHTDNEHIDLNEYLSAIEILNAGLISLSKEISSDFDKNVYSKEEEEVILDRLHALGYLD